MLRAGYGLVWEEWRRTRMALIAAATVIAGVGWFSPLLDRVPVRPQVIYTYVGLGSIFALMIALLVSQADRHDINARIPRRRYLLPVGTFAQVFWPLSYRLVTTGMLAYLYCFVGDWRFGWTGQYSSLAVAFVAVMAFASALAWSAALIGKWLTAVGFFLMIYPGISLAGDYLESRALPFPVKEVALLTGALAVSLAVACSTLWLLRSGGWGLRSRKVMEDAPPDRTTPRFPAGAFPSRVLAQVWFEWRFVGKRIAILLCCPSCAFLTLMIPLADRTPSGQLRTMLDVGWLLLTLMSVPAGLWAFARRKAAARREQGRFIFMLPTDDIVIACGRLGAAAVVVISSFAFVTLYACALYYSARLFGVGAGDEITNVDPIDPSRFAGHMAVVLAAMWIAYTRGGFMVLFFVAYALTGEFVAAQFPDSYSRYWMAAGDLPVSLKIACLLCALLFAATYLAGIRSGGYSWRFLASIAGVWLLVSAASGQYLPQELSRTLNIDVDIAVSTGIVCAGVLVMLALTPFATESIRLHAERHTK